MAWPGLARLLALSQGPHITSLVVEGTSLVQLFIVDIDGRITRFALAETCRLRPVVRAGVL